MLINPPPIKDKLYTLAGTISNVWTIFFQGIKTELDVITNNNVVEAAQSEISNSSSTYEYEAKLDTINTLLLTLNKCIDYKKELDELLLQIIQVNSNKEYSQEFTDIALTVIEQVSNIQDTQKLIDLENISLSIPDSTKSISVWDDLRFPASSVKIAGTKVPTLTAYKGGQILAFSDQAVEANEEQITFIAQLPHTYKQGSSIHPHVHWVGEDNTAGNVRWKFTYSWANINTAFPAESPLYIDAANMETDVHNINYFDLISGDGKQISSILICSLTRNSSHANDTFTGKSAYLLEVDIHYEIDSNGSNTELLK